MAPREYRSLVIVRRCEQVHQVPCCIPVGFVLEGNVEIGRAAKHVEEGPKGEPVGTVGLETKIYSQTIDASLLHRGRSFAQVRCAEVALKKVV